MLHNPFLYPFLYHKNRHHHITCEKGEDELVHHDRLLRFSGRIMYRHDITGGLAGCSRVKAAGANLSSPE